MLAHIKTITTSLLVILAAAAVAITIARSREKEQASEFSQKTESAWQTALKEDPSITRSEALTKKTLRDMEDMHLESVSTERRLVFAAANFLGYYVLNTRGRLAYCGDQGVSIKNFVALFEREHKAELTRSRILLASPDRVTYDPENVTENQFYADHRVEIIKAIELDTKDAAALNKTTVKAICEMLVSQAEPWVSNMHYRNAQPELDRLLVSK